MGTVELFVSEGRDEQLLRFLLRALHLESSCRVAVDDSPRPKLKSDSIELEGVLTVCRHLSLLTNAFPASQLLGATPEEAGQISEWIGLLTNESPSSGDTEFKRLNVHLESRVYLVGPHVTLADLMIYVYVHPAAMTFPAAQFGHFCNLLRWHDFIQETVDNNQQNSVCSLASDTYRNHGTQEAKPEKKKVNDTAANVKPPQKTEAAATSNGATSTSGMKAESSGKSQETKTKEPKEKKEKKPKEAKKKEEPRIDMVDMRIGKILFVKQHPDADSLYIEEIDVGEEKPRQVISGLVKFVSLEEMQGRIVVVCCNLKPAKMKGVQSFGMVMCASDADHTSVEPLVPPQDVKIGDRITFDGYEESPLDEIKPKQKILEALFPDLVTDAEGIAKYKDTPFMTEKGPLRSRIVNGHVS